MSSPVLQLRSVSKSFGGRRAVSELSLAVGAGEVVALLGPNGAGKTTTVRMLVGILRPDSGAIEVALDGRTADRLPRERTGYLPEERGLWRELPVRRTLAHFGRLRGLPRREARGRADAWLERLGLADRAEERVDALSKGNQQRVQLAAAVLHRPAVAVLDEPFTGLDPVSQELFLDLVRELGAAGTAVLLSAHQMDLVERVADRAHVMNRGREILGGTLGELARRLDPRERLVLALEEGADGAALAAALAGAPGVEEAAVDGGAVRLTLRAGASVPELLQRAVALAPVQGIAREAQRLHDVFVRAVREDDARGEER